MKYQVLMLALISLLVTVKGQFYTATSTNDKSFLNSAAIAGRFLDSGKCDTANGGFCTANTDCL